MIEFDERSANLPQSKELRLSVKFSKNTALLHYLTAHSLSWKKAAGACSSCTRGGELGTRPHLSGQTLDLKLDAVDWETRFFSCIEAAFVILGTIQLSQPAKLHALCNWMCWKSALYYSIDHHCAVSHFHCLSIASLCQSANPQTNSTMTLLSPHVGMLKPQLKHSS